MKKAMTLVEILIVIGLMGIIMAAVAPLLRTTRNVWRVSERRGALIQNVRGAMDHMVLHMRRALDIYQISGAGQDASLSLISYDSQTLTWSFDPVNSRILYNPGSTAQTLADNISNLQIACYRADGVTESTTPADIKYVNIAMTATDPEGLVPDYTVTSSAQMRKCLIDPGTELRDAYASVAGSGTWDAPGNALGAADGTFSSGVPGKSHTWTDFVFSSPLPEVGAVKVGLLLYIDGTLVDDNMSLKWCSNTTVDVTRLIDTGSLIRYVGSQNMAWYWVSLTEDRGSWSPADLAGFQVKMLRVNSVSSADAMTVRLDSICLKVAIGTPVQASRYASAYGTGVNEWARSDKALGGPDDEGANADFHLNTSKKQSYGTFGVDATGEINQVKLKLNCFADNSPLVNDYLSVRMARSSDPPVAGFAEHRLTSEVNAFVGAANKGWLTVDVTNDTSWTWDLLSDCEVRMAAVGVGSNDLSRIQIDAVQLNVSYSTGTSGAAIVTWTDR